MTAPIGNQNSSKDRRLWANTLRRAVLQGDAEKLRKIADALLSKAAEGDVAAIRELGDRLDGKAMQQIAVSGNEDGAPIEMIQRVIVDSIKD